MTFGWLIGAPHHVPERGLARGRCEADARRPSVDVVALIDRFDVARERVDAAPAFPCLGEERVVGEPLVLKQRLQRAGAAAETERVDREEAVLRRHVVLLVAGCLELPVQRFAHDDPQRVARRRAMAGREHEFVTIGMLRTTVIVPQAAERGPSQMHGDVVGRVSERAAEMAGLRVIPEQCQGHAGHEPDVLELLLVLGIQQSCPRRCRLYAHLDSPLTGGGFRRGNPSKETKNEKGKTDRPGIIRFP